MTRRRIQLLVALVCSSACAPERSVSSSVGPIGAATTAGEVSRDDPPDVLVDLRAPTRLRWISSTLAPAKPTIDVIVTNRGRTPVDTGNLRVRLEAVRDDISFRCAEDAGPEPRGREPKSLAGDSSLTYELSVLKTFAERYLLEVLATDPAFTTAYRLRRLIAAFVAIHPDHVPPTSDIREFIGGAASSIDLSSFSGERTSCVGAQGPRFLACEFQRESPTATMDGHLQVGRSCEGAAFPDACVILHEESTCHGRRGCVR